VDYFGAIKELYPNITRDDLEIWDEGKGPFIKVWNNAIGVKPDLPTLTSRAQELSDLNLIRNRRSVSYPPIGDQLDAILKQLNLLTNKDPELQAIIDRWLAVKTDNPLPTRSR
jgi:hypothetical protein